MARLIIGRKDFRRKETLGKGAFGTVFRVEDNLGKSFAVKSIACHDRSAWEDSKKEVEMLCHLNHENIVKLFGFDLIKDEAVLLMEFCSQGTLNERLNSPVDNSTKLKWMQELCSAIAYLHRKNIVHRDLKPENILLYEGDRLKVADFGLARHFVSCMTGKIYDNYLSVYIDKYMETFGGSLFWMAPEVFDQRYTEKADIFSLGIIFYAICERKFCYISGNKYYGAFTHLNGQSIGIGRAMYSERKTLTLVFNETGEKLKSIINGMLYFAPQKRISINDVNAQILAVDENGSNRGWSGLMLAAGVIGLGLFIGIKSN